MGHPKFKLIQINPCRVKGRKFYPEDHDYFFQWGMGNLLNSRIAGKYEEIQCENWRLDRDAKKVLSKTLDGIRCFVFPAKRLLFFEQFSFVLIKQLRCEREESKATGIPVVLHFHGMHNLFFSLLAFLFPGFTCILSHHGGCNFAYKRKFIQKSPLRKAGSLFAEWLDKLGLRRVYAAIPQTDYQKNYLEGLGYGMRVLRMPVAGIDRARMEILDRTKSRRRLSLPVNKKIIMQIGRAFLNRGVDRFIELYEREKGDPDLYFLTADAQEKDELFARVVESGIPFRGWVEPQDMKWYMNAADVLVYLPPGDMDLKFGGTSFIPLEALACGTPVIATTLDHFPDPEISQYARIPAPGDGIAPLVRGLLGREIDREAARELVLRYYDWDRVVLWHVELYREGLSAHA